MAHSLLGIFYSQKQQYDQAIAEGERAVALDPNYADSYAVQAEVLSGFARYLRGKTLPDSRRCCSRAQSLLEGPAMFE